ncbi:MAG: hypothetical protein EOM67_14855 [Spirochaetia bacterium]|nr:hypothetical protein [Spirochaetia bacterium]
MPYSNYEILTVLKHIKSSYKDVVLCIEAVHSMPQQGVASTWTFGQHYGMLNGFAMALGFKIEPITPMSWKKFYNLKGKKVSAKESNAETRDKVCSKYPEMNEIKFHSGIFDAILIATYYFERKD